MEELIREAATIVADAIQRSNGPGLHDWVRTFIFGAGAAGVYAIAWVNARSAKNRRAIDVIRSLIADADQLQRTARIYSYRRKDELGDPYSSNPEISYQHDLICVLNIIDTACIEVKEGMVSRKKAKKHLVDYVVSSQSLLDELAPLIDYNPEDRFPVLVEYIGLWKQD